MKNKFLAIVAASAAVLGGALVSAPANAQIANVNQNINVNVTVPEILFLRTITTANVTLLPGDFTGATLAALGSGFAGTDQTAAATVDTTSPFTVGTAITKGVPQAYAVWSNTPRAGGINVIVSAPGSFTSGANTLGVAVAAGSNVTGQAAPGLTAPFVGGFGLDITPLANTFAGTYGGQVNVRVDAP